MAWLVYVKPRMQESMLLIMEASGPNNPRSQSSWMGIPILAAWDFETWVRLWPQDDPT